MLGQEESKANWKRRVVWTAIVALSVHTAITLSGPHGLSESQAMLARIQALYEQQSNLTKELTEKKKRVDSLERGQNIDLEMRRFGRTLPDEVEYKVAEPKVEAPPDDVEPAKR